MPFLAIALVGAVAATAQGSGQTPLSARLANEEPLSSAEIGDMVIASRAAMSGKSFRTYGGFGGAEFLADDVGVSILSYGGERLVHRTRTPATICPGTPETAQFLSGVEGNLVVEYMRREGRWTVRARRSDPEEQNGPMFPFGEIDPADMEDVGLAELRGRRVRGIGYPYQRPENARFEASGQVLWFDIETLLPVRWVLNITAPEAIEYAYWIDHVPDLRIELPDVGYVPDCIGGAGMRYLRSWAAGLTYLHHSGWAVRTNNYVLVFDYVPDNDEAVAALELALHPTAVQHRRVVFFVSHGHDDHFSEDIWRWNDAFDEVTYVLGFDPERELTAVRQRLQVEPRADVQIAGLRVRTIASTDEGVGFLVDADDLKIFHAGDHAPWTEEYRAPYETELRWLAEQAAPVDIGFFPIMTGSCMERSLLFEGAFWAIETLDVQYPMPMHVRCLEQIGTYRQFAVQLADVSDKRSRVIEEPGQMFGYRKDGYPVRRDR